MNSYKPVDYLTIFKTDKTCVLIIKTYVLFLKVYLSIILCHKHMNTEELILNTALMNFAKYGYDGTKIRDIASIAKVNISAINYHFKSKDNLYKTIISQYSKGKVNWVIEPLKNPKKVKSLIEYETKLKMSLDLLVHSVIENPELYSIFKNMDFGVAYGCGVKRIIGFHKQAGINCSELKARKLLNNFISLFPNVKFKLDEIAEETLRTGRINSLGGRPRFFDLDRWIEMRNNRSDKKNINSISEAKEAIKREARNSIVQSTGKDQLLLSCILIRDRIKKYNLKLKQIHTVHDEIITETNETDINEIKSLQYHIEESMILAGEYFINSIPVRVEGKVSKYWDK